MRRAQDLATGMLAILWMGGGCTSPADESVCPAIAIPAFEINVFDSATSEPIPDPVVVTTSGARVDTLFIAGSQALGPYQVSGTFDVSVTKPGYADWIREGVEVEAEECGPNTVRLEAYLAKQPADGSS